MSKTLALVRLALLALRLVTHAHQHQPPNTIAPALHELPDLPEVPEASELPAPAWAPRRRSRRG